MVRLERGPLTIRSKFGSECSEGLLLYQPQTYPQLPKGCCWISRRPVHSFQMMREMTSSPGPWIDEAIVEHICSQPQLVNLMFHNRCREDHPDGRGAMPDEVMYTGNQFTVLAVHICTECYGMRSTVLAHQRGRLTLDTGAYGKYINYDMKTGKPPRYNDNAQPAIILTIKECAAEARETFGCDGTVIKVQEVGWITEARFRELAERWPELNVATFFSMQAAGRAATPDCDASVPRPISAPSVSLDVLEQLQRPAP